MADLEGRTLARYELRQLLGKGGMADVYLAYDTHFDREVAVKVFKREDEDLLRRFIHEAQLMAKLSNPHLMPVYDAGTAALDSLNIYYIVMPFMGGGTLRSRIHRTPLALKDACRYLHDIADALDYMHGQGIVHRDIKASNILLDTEARCYLSDFGIARTTADSTQLTTTGNVLGTVEYMAPELFDGHHKADARSDLYALGVLLFEMVTGRLPFASENRIALVSMHASKRPPSPRSLVSGISPAVEQVILKSLEKQPGKRYARAKDLADAFCRAVDAPASIAVQALDDLVPRANTRRVQQGNRAMSASPVEYGKPSLQSTRAPRPYRPVATTRATERVQQRIVAIFAVIALLIVIIPIAYVITTHSTGPTDIALHLTATAQSNAAATQQRMEASGTAQANATAGVIQTATAGQPSYTSALTSQDEAQWDENAQCAFQSDGYHVHMKSLGFGTQLKGCEEVGLPSYENFATQVDLRELSGHSGGLFFHIKTGLAGSYAGYLFEINARSGQYKISRSDNFSTGEGMHVLQDWNVSKAIATGTVINTLRVLVNDGTLSFSVNNIFLFTAQDTTYSAGDLAFSATTASNEADADMVYSNLSVYTVS